MGRFYRGKSKERQKEVKREPNHHLKSITIFSFFLLFVTRYYISLTHTHTHTHTTNTHNTTKPTNNTITVSCVFKGVIYIIIECG